MKIQLKLVEQGYIPQVGEVLLTEEQLYTEEIDWSSVLLWQGPLDTLVSAVSKKGIEAGVCLLQKLLDTTIAQQKGDTWRKFTCGAVQMHCCAGDYIRIVNEKELGC